MRRLSAAAAAAIVPPASRRQQVRLTTPSTLFVTGWRTGTATHRGLPGAPRSARGRRPGRPPALQRGADAVRADVPFGSSEAGGKSDAVQMVLEHGVAGVRARTTPLASQSTRLTGSAANCSAASRRTAAPPAPAGVAVDVGVERHVEVVRRHVPPARPRPRGQDRLADDVRAHRALGQEHRPSAGQL